MLKSALFLLEHKVTSVIFGSVDIGVQDYIFGFFVFNSFILSSFISSIKMFSYLYTQLNAQLL